MTGEPMLRSAYFCARRVASAILALVVVTGSAAAAADRPGEETLLHCRIAGQDREASLSLADVRVVYRYGRPGAEPELVLDSRLMDVDYRRASGPGDTIDEIVTLANGDTQYRFEAGFREAPRTEAATLRPYGLLTVSRAGRTLARLTCRPDSVKRVPDRLLARMREIGRERTSDGVTFPNYPIHPATRAAQSPPCKADSNVDTCWSRGVSAARSGDLRAALEHYDKSCDARIGTMGCYEAGKLYLHDRQLRDYARARQRLARTCDGDDVGQGPYACKYLGWMYLTGTGVPRDLAEAFGILAQSCFLHNDAMLIDPEGCHFLGRTIFERRGSSPLDDARADYLAYLSFAQGCTDNAQTICDEARGVFQRAAAARAPWIARCDRDAAARGPIATCAALLIDPAKYEAARAARSQLAALFRTVSTSMD